VADLSSKRCETQPVGATPSNLKDEDCGTLKVEAWRNGVSVWYERMGHPPT